MSKDLEKHTFSLTPSSLAEAMEFSKVIADSEFIPKDLRGKPGSILVCIQMGLELGLPPLQSLQGICCINGRPTVYGDTLLALVRASPHFEGIHEEQNENGATCQVKRQGEPMRTVTFTAEDAKRAGLWNKEGPWRQYPRRMLQMRARAFALRDAFADVLKGIAMAEEAQDIPVEDRSRDIEGTTVPANDLNARLKALADSRGQTEATPKPELAEVIEKIAAATTSTEMEQIRTLAKALPEADIQAARDAYTARMKALGEPQPSPAPAT